MVQERSERQWPCELHREVREKAVRTKLTPAPTSNAEEALLGMAFASCFFNLNMVS